MAESYYYEDIKLHEKYRSKEYLLTEQKIIAFGEEWDPDPSHIDPESAKTSRFGTVIAPAVLLMAIWVKLVREQEPKRAYITGLGWDEVRFLLPSRPGDRIVWEEEPLSKRESKSDPAAGIVRCAMKLLRGRLRIGVKNTLKEVDTVFETDVLTFK
ncbi:MAG: MaoC/PaaZ C-terminal domain-containing protein [Dehalococcoidia bacterium]|nr:MaoC/PaaZ C-terminal domain-containing protein [Dehalococcoidia bacterium]